MIDPVTHPHSGPERPSARPRRTRRLGRVVAGVLVVAVLGVTLAAVWMVANAKPKAIPTASEIPTATAPVTRGTVSERSQIGGTLGYDGQYQAVHQAAPGILTTASAPGSIVSRGKVLYAVGNQPVRLLYGAIPAYRDFRSGMADGPDVRQLERNLVDLGLDPHRRIIIDNHFSSTTAAAIRRWQARWGLASWQRTGRLSKGQVAFLPGPLRINQVQAAVGTTVGPNTPVLTATSTRRVINAQVTADRQRLVKVNDRVEVSLTGVATLEGTVVRVGRVATAQPREAGAGESSAPAAVPLTISVTLPPGSPDLDQAPVQLSIVTETRENVLMVPVIALLARSGGGYQVRLPSGRQVEVRPGLYDSSAGTVEVTGNLAAGDLVEVPVQ
ncbi:peptidoglycan-binding protein [Actinopolymorpha alba]|uniref:peptidoglycan-binding protein n=1 Tax=Actinopolymorpha alba TaxID=533267 RepID=UPI0003A3243F|nr:peptidoglycan-binding protein [Actinopolymorpha alba]